MRSFHRKRRGIGRTLIPLFDNVMLFLIALDEELGCGKVESQLPGSFGNLHPICKDLSE